MKNRKKRRAGRGSDLGGRGGGEGGGADLLGVLDSCEGTPVILVGGSAANERKDGLQGPKLQEPDARPEQNARRAATLSRI